MDSVGDLGTALADEISRQLAEARLVAALLETLRVDDESPRNDVAAGTVR